MNVGYTHIAAYYAHLQNIVLWEKNYIRIYVRIMPQSHLHVKLYFRATQEKDIMFVKMKWDVATPWQSRGLHGYYGFNVAVASNTP